MALTPKTKKLMKQARENTTTSLKKDRKDTIIKSGKPLDHSLKQEPNSPVKFGMSKGMTLNMDNYESFRIDVWLSDELQNGETLEQGYKRISEVIDSVIEEEKPEN